MKTYEHEHELSDQELERRRNICVAALRASRAHRAELVEEYISESEHQEGIAYWADNFYTGSGDSPMSFDQATEMMGDFDLYMHNVVEAEVEAMQLGKVDMPGASKADKVTQLIEGMAQNVVEAIDADFETMDEAMWTRLGVDPELAPYHKAWHAAVEAEASGEMTACAFDRYQDWFSDAVRAPMLDQIAIEVLTRAIQISVLNTTMMLRHHYIPVRQWREFVVE